MHLALAFPRFVIHEDLVQACNMLSDQLQIGNWTFRSALALFWLLCNVLMCDFPELSVVSMNVIQQFLVSFFGKCKLESLHVMLNNGRFVQLDLGLDQLRLIGSER